MKVISSTPSKKEIFDLWMEGDHVMVHIDATMEKVIIPNNLKGNKSLTLKLIHLFQGRTESSDQGVNTYLKFSGKYFECILPWDSIFAITSESGEQKIWPNSIQTALVQQIADHIDRKLNVIEDKNPNLTVATDSPTTEKKRAKLQRIK